MKPVALLALALVLTACGGGNEPLVLDNSPNIPPSVREMNAAYDELMQRKEYDLKKVKVQHILISGRFNNSGGLLKNPDRSRRDAEILAAEIWKRAIAGEDFEALVIEFSDDYRETQIRKEAEPDAPTKFQDMGPGVYVMYRDKLSPGLGPRTLKRSQMVKAFGDVAWRLMPDEVGIAIQHHKDSPYGWHIIKRLE